MEAREKSGFYVRALDEGPLNRPERETADSRPSRVQVNRLAQTIISDLQCDDMLQLGAAICSRELMPLKQLSRIHKSLTADCVAGHLATYEDCQGVAALRDAIAKRMLGYACTVTADDVVTTGGCLDAVGLCLRAVASPGDTILVESPAFHCFLQLIEDLNMYVLELPGCPETGIDPDDFEQAVTDNKVSACVLNANFQNPLGSVIPPEKKAKILAAAKDAGVPIIEDDIYGDLFFNGKRPPTFKSMDDDGSVLYCSSFSKTLAPGLRTGWTLPGRFKEKVIRMKLNTCIASPAINQTVIAQFIDTGAYDRHLRRFRNQIKNQSSAMALAIAKHFPAGTRTSFPTGGMFIWVVLDKRVDAMEIYQQAHQKKISILPGLICSSSDRYRNCLRINCGIQWSRRLENGIRTIGDIIKAQYRALGIDF